MPGREKCLAEMVESIIGQVDELHIWRNSAYGEWPGDAGKFAFFHHRPISVFFALDDDLIYPPDYCEYMEDKLDHCQILARQYGKDRYGCYRRSLVSTHGRDYTGIKHVDRYYHGDVTARYRGLDRVTGDHRVDVPGSGSSVFRPRNMMWKIKRGAGYLRTYFPTPNMADLHLAK